MPGRRQRMRCSMSDEFRRTRRIAARQSCEFPRMRSLSDMEDALNSQDNKEKSRKLYRFLSHLSLLFTGISFAGMNVLMQYSFSQGQDKLSMKERLGRSTFFSWYRLAGSAPLLLFASLCKEGISPWRTFYNLPRKEKLCDIYLFLAAGVIGMFVNQCFFIIGLALTSGATAAVFQPLTPVITAVIAVLTGIEKFSCCRFFGVLVAVCGVMTVIIFHSKPKHLHSSDENQLDTDSTVLFLGCSFLLLGAFGASIQVLSQKPLVKRYPTIFITFIVIVIATIACSGMASYFAVTMPNEIILPKTEIVTLLYSVIVSTCINYGLMCWATRHVDATVINLYTMVQPPATMLLSYAFFPKQKLSWSVALSSFFILVGLLITTLFGRNDTDFFDSEEDITITAPSCTDNVREEGHNDIENTKLNEAATSINLEEPLLHGISTVSNIPSPLLSSTEDEDENELSNVIIDF
eukprot:g268.t1